MGFVAPVMLLGIVGVAIPLVIHLMGKRRARVVRFAAVDFLLGTDRKVSRWLLLRERLLLLARMLVCAAFPLAFAQPFLRCDAPSLPASRGPQAAVVIVDNSAISQYTIDGETLLAREKRKAEAMVALLGPEAEVAVVAAAEGAQAPVKLSRDPGNLSRRLAAIGASCRGARMDVALERAYGLLDAAKYDTRTVFVLSPLTAAGFSAEPPSPPPGIEIVTIDPAEGQPLENVGVTAVTTMPASEVGPRGIAVIAQVANYTDSEQTPSLSLHIGGDMVARGEVTIAAKKIASKRFSAVLPAGTAPSPVSVSVKADHFSLDDTRFAIAAAGKRPRVLLVNGAPRTTRHEDELFYLSTALAPNRADSGGANITITTPDLLATTDLSVFDVIVLANVRALSEKVVAGVADHVDGGSGLLVTVGDNVDPEAYARTMAPLLPAPLATLRDVARASGGTSSTTITDITADHPVMSAVSTGEGGLESAAFEKLMLLSPSQESGSKILARYASGAPAMVAGHIGKGRTLLFTSTIDRDWTDLPVYPAYVALVRRAIRYLAGQHAPDRAIHEIVCGQPAMIPVLPGDAHVAVEPPGGGRTIIDPSRITPRNDITFRDTSRPGIYRVLAASDDGDLAPRPGATFVVNVDPRVADAQRIDSSTLPRGATTKAAALSFRKRRVGLSQYLAALVLALLVLEAAFLFRR